MFLLPSVLDRACRIAQFMKEATEGATSPRTHDRTNATLRSQERVKRQWAARELEMEFALPGPAIPLATCGGASGAGTSGAAFGHSRSLLSSSSSTMPRSPPTSRSAQRWSSHCGEDTLIAAESLKKLSVWPLLVGNPKASYWGVVGSLDSCSRSNVGGSGPPRCHRNLAASAASAASRTAGPGV